MEPKIGAVALAPMDGVTDHVYRDLLTSRARPGALSFTVSEFVRVTSRPLSADVIRRTCPEVSRGGVTRAGTPVLVQLLGGQPEPLAATARTAIEAGASGVDLNFGCPAKLVNRHDGGASLLKTPERIERIVASVRAAVPARHPVSAKIRLGWDCSDQVTEIALAAERGGATFLTIHGRTKADMYGPPADWEAIGRARRAIGISTIANGDLNTRDALARCRDQSGCESFMLGRGPMGRPSLLCGEGNTDADSERRLLTDLLLDYLARLQDAHYTESLCVARVKQWLSLGSKVNPDVRPLFEPVKRLLTVRDVRTMLERGAA
ncbi:MAG TPA: tRNA-dihydrouridine synthase family protein [Polyangiaceae bacterium]|nr:tRNA-dihydrouridine synthase family protein [Polyangiaceae bacterium]